ncbi:hypothetical protein WAI453_006930 [Rhynchosporium graminicola]|uniref:Uncharacterized protein n=1 Tax=Rhynchosporium graminicola TaxID=2792576 RepID=A0A1E1KTT8_9HELO|nr:uncharacterized protein RCO7_02084 [Rhynchosporium commune]
MSKFRGAGKWRVEGHARSNTGSSIRAKSISQPIPFPDDDEFPIRTPGSGIALPLSADGTERLRETRANGDIDIVAHQTGIAVSDYTTGTRAPPMPTEPPPPLPDAQIMRTIQGHRPNQPSGLRNSITSVPDAPSIEKPQRKKSSLRSVFGKLFGRKKKETSPSSSERASKASDVRAGQHRSVPSALNRTPHGTMSPQKRSASLPINEFNRALRSHSIGATDFQEFGDDNDDHSNRESLQGDGQSRPRRATTPSRLWTPNKIPGHADWTGLSPRPASSHARGSKAVSDEANAAVGIALKGSSHLHRRSRSVGELQEAMRVKVVARRRSDEIRYWRQSYDPGWMSPMSSNKAEMEEPIPMEPEDRLDDDTSKPEPFNFGPMGEMAGMKITQAASLETRVQRLESRIHKMERDVSRTRNHEALQLQDPPKRHSARNRSDSGTRSITRHAEASLPQYPRNREAQNRGDSYGSRRCSQNGSSFYSSSRPSTMSTNNNQLQPFDEFSPEQLLPIETAQSTARPLSTSTTIRGIPSGSPTGGMTLTGEHFKALIDMIHAEQSARLKLEAVIHSLQRQLQTVLIASGTTYPTTDSDTAGNQLHQGKTSGGSFSNSEQDDSSDDGRYVNEEVFQTPMEEKNRFEDEIFGDGSNITDGKNAPRTLSLGQITLGRNVQPSLNF